MTRMAWRFDRSGCGHLNDYPLRQTFKVLRLWCLLLLLPPSRQAMMADSGTMVLDLLSACAEQLVQRREQGAIELRRRDGLVQ